NSKSDDIYFNASNLPPNITVNSTGSSSNTGTQTQTSSTPSGQTGNNTITGPTNPIQDTNLFDLFFRLLKILMGILGAIAVLMIIIGGFRMVIAQGNEEAYTKAKSTITWAIIGLVIALLSFSIVIIVQNILGANLPSVNTDSNGSVQVK
ncbi:MAG TPA: pilin, partial [Patescibacteria group bacterium]|nr:pilin [Patescibacteria group bacterium]